MSSHALGADEVIELGQDGPPSSATRSELQEIRSVVDAWIGRFSKEVTALVAKQSALARQEGQNLFSLWAAEVGATFGVVAHPAEVWEMTRSVAFKLLNVAGEFAQAYHEYFTDEQDRTLTMAMDGAAKSIETANQFAKALRPELLEALRVFISAATKTLIDAGLRLARILERIGLAAAAIPELPLDILDWIKENVGTIVLVGVGTLVAAAVLPPLLAQAFAPAPRLSGILGRASA